MLYNGDITKQSQTSVDQGFVLLSIYYIFVLYKLFSLNVILLRIDIIFVENTVQQFLLIDIFHIDLNQRSHTKQSFNKNHKMT